MKTDLYTKVVLTVIAVALTVNVVKSFFVTPAKAAAVTKVIAMPVNADGTINVNIKSITTDSWAFSSAAPIPVVVKK